MLALKTSRWVPKMATSCADSTCKECSGSPTQRCWSGLGQPIRMRCQHQIQRPKIHPNSLGCPFLDSRPRAVHDKTDRVFCGLIDAGTITPGEGSLG